MPQDCIRLRKICLRHFLKLGDKTILEMVTDKIDEVSDVENIYIVTNESFISSLKSGAKAIKARKKLKVINDHTTSNDNRLGAIGDLKYVIVRKISMMKFLLWQAIIYLIFALRFCGYVTAVKTLI